MDSETGRLADAEIEALLNALPGDITFVGKDDTILYYNRSLDPLFGAPARSSAPAFRAATPRRASPASSRCSTASSPGPGRRRVLGGSRRQAGSDMLFRRAQRSGEYLGCLEFADDVTAASPASRRQNLAAKTCCIPAPPLLQYPSLARPAGGCRFRLTLTGHVNTLANLLAPGGR